MASQFAIIMVTLLLRSSISVDDAEQNLDQGECIARIGEDLSRQKQSLESLQKEIADWLSSAGGFLHPAAKIAETVHSGVTLRGVVATEALKQDTTILTVPRKLWVQSNKFPSIMEKQLDGYESCKQLNDGIHKYLKYSAALALEQAKGPGGEYWTYVQTMPSTEEMNFIMPRLIGPALAQDFKAFPLVRKVKAQQRVDNKTRLCFEEWQKYDVRISELQWDDVWTTFFATNSRQFGFPAHEDGSGLVIFADLLNTEIAGRTNVAWEAPNDAHPDEFRMYLNRDVEAGTELLDDYCATCDNEHMVDSYGIYFEHNENRFNSSAHIDCNDESLRAAATTVLKAVTDEDLLAPRCKDSVWSEKNGGIRCSLARIAWEYCSCVWQARECPSGFGVFTGSIVSCGGHTASSCFECPQGNGEAWCNGECEWHDGSCKDVLDVV